MAIENIIRCLDDCSGTDNILILCFRGNPFELKKEVKRLVDFLNDEIQTSKTLDEILFNSLTKARDKFTSLHRPLKLYNE